MSGSLNKVMVIGNLVRDPEGRSFQNGGKVVSLRVATSESWKDKNSGEKKEKSEFHSVSIFSEGTANFAERYLRKGSKVYVEGQLETRKWQDQSGTDRYSTEIVIRPYSGSLTDLSGPRNDGGLASETTERSFAKGQEGHIPGFDDDGDDSDLPF